jgi:hypothetical protein
MSKRAGTSENLRKRGSGDMSKSACAPARSGGIAIRKHTTPRVRSATR